jgi:hypothetical protein
MLQQLCKGPMSNQFFFRQTYLLSTGMYFKSGLAYCHSTYQVLVQISNFCTAYKLADSPFKTKC